jgi:hypothetical protein
MVGPEKGTVEVIPHYASWRYAFERKRRVLQEHIGDHVLDIEDVGAHVQVRRGLPWSVAGQGLTAESTTSASPSACPCEE